MTIWRFSTIKKVFLWMTLIFFVFMAAFFAHLLLTLTDVSDLRIKNPEKTAWMDMRIAQEKKQGRDYVVRYSWVPFENVPQLLKDTVRIAEDAGFYWHKGVDFEELKEAIKKNLQEKKFVRGGSTITQQLAKNLYLSPQKSLTRKLREYLIARKLEKKLSKDRIFELYLNVIELGHGVFGIQAASLHYFGCSVEELSLERIVRLVAILPRPLNTDPREDSPWLSWRCRWLLHKLQLYGYITDEMYRENARIFGETLE